MLCLPRLHRSLRREAATRSLVRGLGRQACQWDWRPLRKTLPNHSMWCIMMSRLNKIANEYMAHKLMQGYDKFPPQCLAAASPGADPQVLSYGLCRWVARFLQHLGSCRRRRRRQAAPVILDCRSQWQSDPEEPARKNLNGDWQGSKRWFL